MMLALEVYIPNGSSTSEVASMGLAFSPGNGFSAILCCPVDLVSAYSLLEANWA